jgi:hypothetical protein
MYADRQPTTLTLTARPRFKASGDGFCFLDDTPGSVEEFLPDDRWPSATIRSFEERRP